MKLKKSTLVCLVVLLLFCTVTCHSQFVINENSAITSTSLHKFTSIINVKQKQLSIKQVLTIPSNKFSLLPNENTDLGFTDDNYWLHFAIKNTTDSDLKFYLESSRPVVDIADLYKVVNNKVVDLQLSGDEIPFKSRSFKHRKTIFTIYLLPNSTSDYYVHLKSDGEVINAPILLTNAESLVSKTSFEQIVFGFFYGILSVASILYFFFFFAMKEKVFLYYSLYVVFIGLLQFSLDGYFYQFITPGAGWFSDKSVLIFAVVSGFFLGKYAQTYLNVKKLSSNLYICFNVLYAFFGILFTVILLAPHWYKFCYPAMNALGLFLLILIISSLLVTYIKTKQIYQFFTLGVISLVTGFVIFILKNFSVLPDNFITENSSKLGTGFEVIFLSLSMASLIRNLKQDRENLQAIALQKAEEMSEMKSYFLSNISHELRTPLNTIMNFIDSIDGETDSKSIQEKCQIIKSSSTGLLSSVNDILDFSKIEKDEITLDEIEFDAHKLFEEIKTNITIKAKTKDLDFQYVQASDLPKMMKGDVNRIRQIVMNLLYNAIKFTENGTIEFKVGSKIIDDIVSLTFEISDTGEGIAKEKMNSIFDSFSQQTINNKRKYGGLGLGLYIVKALVNLHKGSIDMQSKVNEGTVCVVEIHVGKVEINNKTEPITLDYDLLGKRILVVEDNTMNQMVLKMITKKWLNTEVDFAENGQLGLALMQNIKYDVVLMDLQMPVMDGYEATIEIRKGNSGINDKDIPVIAITADVMEATKLRVEEIGMNYYLSKPVSKELLFETIKKFT
ncbi:7TM diverse intracellular signaling domain-containing protein [Flavobacterium sp.]|uniref:hybrid sensor histidine kinase/response regulator n=1 Tax=Flavobacterium sp. TaxID=239 RepID=UPI0037526B87